ncbi:hypothetical protein RB195_023025 [Necator americanus]|uniref:Uncharacterized protein n=1 Tax=Necator americanus TaxID=51031 RepID=A0ABR1EHI1_NECAM
MLKNNGSYEKVLNKMPVVDLHHQRSQTASLPIRNSPYHDIWMGTWATPSAVMERLDCTERKLLRRLSGIWDSDEWIGSVQVLAEDREGWAELCLWTTYIGEDEGNRVTDDISPPTKSSIVLQVRGGPAANRLRTFISASIYVVQGNYYKVEKSINESILDTSAWNEIWYAILGQEIKER